MTRTFRLNRYGLSLVVAGVAFLLSGCGSSPTVRYYSLGALDAGSSEAIAGTPRLGIGPFRVPDYLTRAKIVTRGDDAEVLIDDFNRWLEPVGEAFHTVVATNVDALTDDVVAVAFPYRFLHDAELRVVGRVERFDADSRGNVVLVVQWGITAGDPAFLLPPRRSVYEIEAAAADYNAIAQAMSEALERFSRDVADGWQSVRQH